MVSVGSAAGLNDDDDDNDNTDVVGSLDYEE